MLDPFACGLHADVSLFCFFVFYTKRKVFESLNVIKEMVSVQRATIKLLIHLGGFLSSQEAKVALGYRLVRLLRPIYTARLCRMRQAYDRPTT